MYDGRLYMEDRESHARAQRARRSKRRSRDFRPIQRRSCVRLLKAPKGAMNRLVVTAVEELLNDWKLPGTTSDLCKAACK